MDTERRHRTRSSARTCGGVAAVIAVSAAAHAQPASVEIVWNAPAACPAREDVVAEVAHVLGQAVAGPVTHARADVSSDERGRWHAALSVESRGARSERTLEAETCQAIASAVAVIVAVTVERGLPPTPAPTSTSTPTPAPAPTPTQRPPSPYQSRMLVGADASFDGFVPSARTMPGFAVGPDASVGWFYASGPIRFRVMGTGGYFPHGSAYRPTGEGGDFDLLTVAGRACAAVAAGRFDVGPCMGSELESMRAFPVNFNAAHPFAEASARWWSLAGSGLAHWTLSRSLALSVRLDTLVFLRHPYFQVSPSVDDVVHRPSPVAIRAALGVEMHFF